jgi:hypothetical protein
VLLGVLAERSGQEFDGHRGRVTGVILEREVLRGTRSPISSSVGTRGSRSTPLRPAASLALTERRGA